MKNIYKISFLAMLPLLACRAQQNLSTPVTILRPADVSKGGQLNLQDSIAHNLTFIAPTTITTYGITAATGANPMVLTLDSAASIDAGSIITISGATGAGCSIMNGAQSVAVVAGTSVTLTLDGTGCTYTANSAVMVTAYWILPGTDGLNALCSNGLSVLSFACTSITVALSNGNSPIVLTNGLVTLYSGNFATTANKRVQLDHGGATGGAAVTIFDSSQNNAAKLTDLTGSFGGALWLYRSGTQFLTIDGSISSNPTYTADAVSGLTTHTFTSSTTSTNLNVGVAGSVQGGINVLNTTSASVNIVGNSISVNNAGGVIGIQAVAGASGGTIRVYSSSGPTVVDLLNQSGITTSGTLTLSSISGLTQCLQVDSLGVVSGTGSACGGGGGLPVADTTEIVFNATDNTKGLKLSAASLTTGTIRTLTAQDANYTLAGINLAETWTANQTYSTGSILASGSPNIGSTGNYFNQGFFGTVITNGINLTFGGANKSSIGWDNANGATSIVSNISTVLFEFENAGLNVSYASLVPSATTSWNLGGSSARWSTIYGANEDLSGTLTLPITGSFQCLQANTIGQVSGIGAPCGLVAAIIGSSPISASGSTSVTVSCPTCVATSGTYSMTGNYTITQNLYLRSGFSSVGVSCGSVADGWTAITSDDYFVTCIGGNRFRAQVVSY